MGINKNLMKFNKILILMLCFIVCLSLVSAEITILHEFAGQPDDGSKPYYGHLILDSGKLYGMTAFGGDSDYGTVFSMGSDGSNFSLLREFAGSPDDGKTPLGGLIMDSGKLYGMTKNGGDSDYGTVFSMGSDGSNFSLLREFAGGVGDGKWPYSSFILDSGKFYGMTSGGGDSDSGTIFSIGPDGSDFTLLHEFTGGGDDGKQPIGSLILDSGTLYGTTRIGGDSNLGTIFSIGTNGAGYLLLHEFAGQPNDGKYPYANFILDSGKLYGMTRVGGDSDYGTIFSIGSDGSDFSLLHNFTGGGDDGKLPYGNLIMDSGKFYGTTSRGGDSDNGTVFSIGTDGSNFSLLHEFTGGGNDGNYPLCGLILGSGKLYGMTMYGGDSNLGTIFSIQIGGNEPIYTTFTSEETTNFSAVDLTNVTNLTLAIIGKGKIKFPITQGINTEGENYDTNVDIGDAVIYVNSAALDSTFNNSATLTFENVNCNMPYIYYSATATTRSAILAENTICPSSICSNIQCTGSTLTVDVTHFSGYAVNGSANLTIDADDPKSVLEDVTFTAIYMNATGFITDATCNISFSDGSHIMDNQTDHYNYTRTFAAAETIDYNVTCSATGENTVFANDTAVINEIPIPEFSTITLGLGLIAVLAGLFVIRRKK